MKRHELERRYSTLIGSGWTHYDAAETLAGLVEQHARAEQRASTFDELRTQSCVPESVIEAFADRRARHLACSRLDGIKVGPAIELQAWRRSRPTAARNAWLPNEVIQRHAWLSNLQVFVSQEVGSSV